jgi:hypothetical protein
MVLSYEDKDLVLYSIQKVGMIFNRVLKSCGELE